METKESVILGSASQAATATKASDALVNGVTYSNTNFAGNSYAHNGLYVSVGGKNSERQIKNVGAGEITATSTDAINGSQLYLVANEAGKHSTVNGTGPINVTATDNPNGSKNYNVSVDTAPVNAKDGKLDNSTVATKPDALAKAGDVINAVNSSYWSVLDNSGTKKADVNPGDKVKFINGKNTTSTVTQEANGETTVTFNVDLSNIQVTNATLTPNATGKIDVPTTATGGDNLVNATTVAEAINASGWNLNIARDDAEFTDQAGNTSSKVSPGDEAIFQASKNLKIKKDGNNITYATKDEVDFTHVNSTNGITFGNTTGADTKPVNLTVQTMAHLK